MKWSRKISSILIIKRAPSPQPLLIEILGPKWSQWILFLYMHSNILCMYVLELESGPACFFFTIFLSVAWLIYIWKLKLWVFSSITPVSQANDESCFEKEKEVDKWIIKSTKKCQHVLPPMSWKCNVILTQLHIINFITICEFGMTLSTTGSPMLDAFIITIAAKLHIFG